MKKLTVLFLAVAFVCATTIGCTDTKPTGGAPKTGTTEKKEEKTK